MNSEWNNTFDIEESDEHCLHLWYQYSSSRRSWDCGQFPLQTLSFRFGTISKASCFISSDDNFWQKVVRQEIHIKAPRRRNTHVLSAPQLPHNWS